jgi:hypothetical protein
VEVIKLENDHKCDFMAGLIIDGDKIELRDEWELSLTNSDQARTIKYCPWCGEQLWKPWWC